MYHPFLVQSTLCVFRPPFPKARFYWLLLPKPYRTLQPYTVPGSLGPTVFSGWKGRKDINQDIALKRSRTPATACCVKERYILLRGEVGYLEVLVEAMEGREDSLRGGGPSNIWEKPERAHGMQLRDRVGDHFKLHRLHVPQNAEYILSSLLLQAPIWSHYQLLKPNLAHHSLI